MTKEEAIKIVKNNWPEGRVMLKEALETLIPELKESEDDRIRKALKEYFINSFQYKGVVAISGVHIKNIIAWLEKQGEQNPADKVELKFKIGDCITHINANESYKILDIRNGYYVCENNHLWNIESQEYFEIVKQKPTEWSEEDKKHLLGCINYFSGITESSPYYNDFLWLKSIKERYTWKPSDEQMATFWDAISNLNHDNYKWIDDLKSLYQDLQKLSKK